MEDKKFKVIIVEDVKLELKGTEEIFRHEIPNAEVIGTAMTEQEFWTLIEAGVPDLVLLDLGLGGSTTIGVDICRNIFKRYPGVHVLIFTGEILNEKLWVDVLEAGADGIILKTGELLTKTDVQAVMDGKWKVEPIWGGAEMHMVRLSNISKDASKKVVDDINATYAKMEKQEFDVFTGPIVDNEGKVQIPEGKRADDKMLTTMNYFVKGVIGKVPTGK